MERNNSNVVDELGFTEQVADNYIQADMTRQVIEYVQTQKLTLKSAASLFNLQENLLGQLMNGQLDILSDDELGDIVNLILARTI